ncbi:arsenical pump-driving ATPase [soil metagenome]
MTPLRQAVGDAPFIFVVGKGGVGKTTTAGALALEYVDAGVDTHLISTDPAHSLGDLHDMRIGGEPVPSPCSGRLILEEFDAAAHARRWLDRAAGPVTEIIEGGSYLDADDVAGFTRMALPGLDEMMAVLRLVDLAGADRRVVVDTAPTGHTLRMLDAADTHAGFARALRAMADKAAAVASGFARRSVRLAGEAIIEEIEGYVADYRARVLRPSACVVVTRGEVVVRAESRRLAAALQQRGLWVAATVCTGEPDGVNGPLTGQGSMSGPHAEQGAVLAVPFFSPLAGCDGLRRWRDEIRPVEPAPAGPDPVAAAAGAPLDDASASAVTSSAEPADSPRAARPAVTALHWLLEGPTRLLLFAGKGGTGKTTCAAAAAIGLAGERAVLLCSTDPAGSIDDVVGAASVPGLRLLQIEADAELARLRDEYRVELLEALDRIGLNEAATLDRRVIEALWEMAPPGIDEFAALAAMLDAADSRETMVLDTAPTGHFLRLLTMPQIALDWTRQLMRVIVKYRATGAAGGAAEALLRTARQLRGLQELIHDPVRTGVIVVTLDEPMVRAETGRLLQTLLEAEIPVAGVLLNRARVSSRASGEAAVAAAVSAAVSAAAADAASLSQLRARLREPPPVGPDALREFLDTWNICP